MSGLGHNQGPTMEPGESWRRTCWTSARKALLPTLPLQIVRLRVKRAQALGLDYTTYATVRATTGRDIIGFLFSDNALRLDKGDTPPTHIQHKLRSGPDATTALAVYRPRHSEALKERLAAECGIAFDIALRAPTLRDTPEGLRKHLQTALREMPGDAVLLVGNGPLEQSWTATARLAGYVSSERYFR